MLLANISARAMLLGLGVSGIVVVLSVGSKVQRAHCRVMILGLGDIAII